MKSVSKQMQQMENTKEKKLQNPTLLIHFSILFLLRQRKKCNEDENILKQEFFHVNGRISGRGKREKEKEEGEIARRSPQINPKSRAIIKDVLKRIFEHSLIPRKEILSRDKYRRDSSKSTSRQVALGLSLNQFFFFLSLVFRCSPIKRRQFHAMAALNSFHPRGGRG